MKGHPLEIMNRLNPPPTEEIEVVDYSTAFRSMIDENFLKSIKYSEQQMRADRTAAHPDILEFEKKFVTKCYKLKIPVFAHCVMRDKHTQNELFVKGHSKAVYGKSAHNYGFAVDIIHSTKAWNLDRLAWSELGHIGKELAIQAGIKIEWGGDWKFYDPAHWEIKNWKQFIGPQPMPQLNLD